MHPALSFTKAVRRYLRLQTKVVVLAGVEPTHAADLAERRHKLPVLPLHHRTKVVAKEGVEPSRLSWFEQVSSADSE